MLKLTLRLLVLFAVMGMLIPVFADLSPQGDPVVIGSWTQQFIMATGQLFDTVVITMATPGIVLAAGGHTGMDTLMPFPNNSTWTISPADDLHSVTATATATGAAVSALLFNLYFSSDISTALTFNFAASGAAGSLAGSATWSGKAFANDPGVWSIGPAPVNLPESSTSLLRGSWLLGIATLIIRRRKTRQPTQAA